MFMGCEIISKKIPSPNRPNKKNIPSETNEINITELTSHATLLHQSFVLMRFNGT
jgi:hypothetical protein